ncbi:MAG: hypothetical protein U5L45_23285 [Saprospiraceae bacterium]|nr:hypothetical protein [Saprospiraceae bacterium]
MLNTIILAVKRCYHEVLDGQGKLTANAPHIPVHLGSLGVCVRLLN